MRDQSLTAAEAAKWLGCTVEAVHELVQAGRLRRHGAPGRDEPVLVSLNSVVVLAESLPVERGVFLLRDPPSGDAGGPGGASGSGSERSRHGGGVVVERRERPALIVEHRPLRPRLKSG